MSSPNVQENMDRLFNSLPKTTNIHVMNRAGNGLVWSHSKGIISPEIYSILTSNIDKVVVDTRDILSERKLTILSGLPGSGKSITSMYLLLSYKNKYTDTWVMSVDSDRLYNSLEDLSPNDYSIEILCSIHPKEFPDDVSRRYFEYMLKEREGGVVLLFDNIETFTHSSQEGYFTRIIGFIKYLNLNTKAKIFITIRSNLITKSQLENELSYPINEFNSFTEIEVSDLFYRSYKGSLRLVNEKKELDKITNRKSFTDLNRDIIKKFNEKPKLIDLPLYTDMYSKLRSLSTYNTQNLFELYKGFTYIHYKLLLSPISDIIGYDILTAIISKELDRVAEKLIYQAYHPSSSMSRFLYSPLQEQILDKSDNEMSVEQGSIKFLEKIGLVYDGSFVHSTFSEYYMSRLVYKKMKEILLDHDNFQQHKNKIQFLLTEFMIKNQYMTQRGFLDDQLGKDENKWIKVIRKNDKNNFDNLKKLFLSLESRQLHLASDEGNISILTFLMDMDYKVNLQDSNGITPLHLASSSKVISALLNRGGKLDILDNLQSSIIHSLVEHKKYSALSFILTYLDSSQMIFGNQERNILTLNVNTRGGDDACTPLHTASKLNDVKSAEILLKHGGDINARNNEGATPIIYGINHNTDPTEIVMFLAKQDGIDFEYKYKGLTAVALLCFKPRINNKLLKFLLDNGAVANPLSTFTNSQGNTIEENLINIINRHLIPNHTDFKEKVIQELTAQRDISVNSYNSRKQHNYLSHGNIPLLKTTYRKSNLRLDVEILKKEIEETFDSNIKAYISSSEFLSNTEAMTRYLVQIIELYNSKGGKTIGDDEDIVSKCNSFLESDVSVNSPYTHDLEKKTALQYAIKLENIYLIDLYLNNLGGDPNVKSSTGESSLELAIKLGNPEIFDKLLNNQKVQQKLISSNKILSSLENLANQKLSESKEHEKKEKYKSILEKITARKAGTMLITSRMKKLQCSSRVKRKIGMPCVDSSSEQQVIEDNREVMELLEDPLIEEINSKELYQTKGTLESAKEVTMIRPEQILNDGININVKIPNEELMIGSTKDLLNTENYTLDEETSEIKLKLGDKEYTLMAKVKEKEGDLHTRHYLTLSGGYTVKLSHLIANSGQNEIRQAIYDKLTTLELLDQKLHIEKIADITISDQDYESDKITVKKALIEKGVSSEHAEKLISNIESSTSEVFTRYVNDIKSDLVKNGVEVSNDKFELAKVNGVRGGKWFSIMAIYDLIDSTRDLSTIGRHDNNALKQVFGLNGILDSINDVRQSLSTTYLQGSTIKMKFSPNSKIGKIISKMPLPVRKSFVRFIDNPAVRGLTFATIAYQFGYSANEISKGDHNPLNYYWLGSSGIKLGSMGIGYVSAGASFVMGGLSSSVMRAVSFASKILGKLSIITAVLDVVISICIDIHQSVVYTEKIAESIPLSLLEKAAIGFDHSLLGFLIPGEKDKEAENIIKIKNILSTIKNKSVNLIKSNEGLATVINYFTNINITSKIILKNYSINLGLLEGPLTMSNNYVLGDVLDTYSGINVKQTDSNIVPYNDYLHQANLSSLNLTQKLNFNLVSLNRTQVYIDKKYIHIPHITIDEYNSGLRIYNGPRNCEISNKKKVCILYINKNTTLNSLHEGMEIGKCNVEYIRNTDEPMIVHNVKRENGMVLYDSVPSDFVASKYYSAMINVPSGQVKQIGSENYVTNFLVSDYSYGRIHGGVNQYNNLIVNIDKEGIIVIANLYDRNIQYGSDKLELENVYNLVVNVKGNAYVYTDCKTRYINCNSTKNSYIFHNHNSDCTSTDLEIREVNTKNVHFRGLKQTIFIVSKHSDGAKILNTVGGKSNVDVIKIKTEDKMIDSNPSTIQLDASSKIEDLKLEKNKNGHTLLLMKSTNPILKASSFSQIKENAVTSIEIDSFTNLEIEKNGKRYVANIDTMELEPISELPQKDTVYNGPPVKLYNPDEQGLQIYRDDEENIGLIDLRDKSILNCTMNIIDDRLVLLHKGIPFIKVENWKTNPSARRVIFAFKGIKVFDHECIVDYCSPETVIEKVKEAQKLSPKIENLNEKYLPDFTRIIPLITSNSDEDTNRMINSAQNVKGGIEKYEENDLSSAINNNLKDFKGMLIELVRDITFSEELCIKNVRFDEHLYAACNYFNYNHDSRRVFTWITDTSEKDKKFKWKLEYYRGSSFYIKNVEYDEYLYCTSSIKYSGSKPSVFTWTPRNALNSKFEWEFTVSNGSLLIKNTDCDGYLYADVYHDKYKDRRLLSIESKLSENSLWKVAHCSPELRLKRNIKETGTIDGVANIDKDDDSSHSNDHRVKSKAYYIGPFLLAEASTIEYTSIATNSISSPTNDFITWAKKYVANLFIPTDYLNEHTRRVAHDLCSKLESNLDEYKGRNVSKCEESIFNTAKSLPNPEEFMNVLSKDVNHRLEVNYACEKKYSSIERENALQNVNHRKEYLDSCRQDTTLDRQMINNNIYLALSKAKLWDKAFSIVDGNIMLVNLFLTLFQKAKDKKIVESKFEELSEYHKLYCDVLNRTKIKTEINNLIKNNNNVTINIAKEDLYDSNLVFSFLFGTEKEISDDLSIWLKDLIHSKELTEIKQVVDSRNFNELIKPIVKKIIRANENNKLIPKISRISLEFKKACGKIVKEIPQASISGDDIYDSYRLDFISLVTQGINAKEITSDLFKRVDLLIRNRQSEEKGWFNKIKTVLLAILPTPGGITEDNKRHEDLELLKIRIESIVSEAINPSMSSEVNNHIYSNNLPSMTNSNLKPILSPPFTLIREPSLISNTLPSPVFNQISVEPVVNNTTMIS